MNLAPFAKTALIAALVSVGAACQSAAPTRTTASDGAAPVTRTQAAYTLGSGDMLRVTVFGQEDISGEYEIDGSGSITMPLIGEVQAIGETTRSLKETVRAQLAEGYLREPNVSIEVMNYRPFYILGEVGNPGEYNYTAGISVMNAVAAAGGFTYRANRKVAFITAFEDDEEIAVRLNSTLQVQPGDTIRIGERLF